MLIKVTKMLTKKDIILSIEKIEKQLARAGFYLKENELDDALYYVWLAAENLINLLKISVNGFYLKDHKEKSDVLKAYYSRSMLNKDYSLVFEKLSKYRLAAQFEPYTSIPKDYTKDDVNYYLNEILSLKKEIYKFLKEKGKI